MIGDLPRKLRKRRRRESPSAVTRVCKTGSETPANLTRFPTRGGGGEPLPDYSRSGNTGLYNKPAGGGNNNNTSVSSVFLDRC